MPDEFAAHPILLVEEFQARVGDARDGVPVMQRCGGGVVADAIHGEMDVFEEEGLRTRLGAKFQLVTL